MVASRSFLVRLTASMCGPSAWPLRKRRPLQTRAGWYFASESAPPEHNACRPFGQKSSGPSTRDFASMKPVQSPTTWMRYSPVLGFNRTSCVGAPD
jgi:hypothetical protein